MYNCLVLETVATALSTDVRLFLDEVFKELIVKVFSILEPEYREHTFRGFQFAGTCDVMNAFPYPNPQSSFAALEKCLHE